MKPEVFLRALRDARAAEPARPLSPSERARHRRWRLPNDLLGFLKRANGLAFAGGARLLPLREIRTATEVLYQDQEEEGDVLPPGWLALTDDPDGPILVLDLRARTYFAFEDEAEEIGTTFEEALDWIYARYVG